MDHLDLLDRRGAAAAFAIIVDDFHKLCSVTRRGEICGNEMARFIHDLAPLDDPAALQVLRGAVVQAWVTAAEVGIAARMRAVEDRCSPLNRSEIRETIDCGQ